MATADFSNLSLSTYVFADEIPCCQTGLNGMKQKSPSLSSPLFSLSLSPRPFLSYCHPLPKPFLCYCHPISHSPPSLVATLSPLVLPLSLPPYLFLRPHPLLFPCHPLFPSFYHVAALSHSLPILIISSHSSLLSLDLSLGWQVGVGVADVGAFFCHCSTIVLTALSLIATPSTFATQSLSSPLLSLPSSPPPLFLA